MYFWNYLACIIGIIWYVLLELFDMYYWNYFVCNVLLELFGMHYWNYLVSQFTIANN
jgi:hypothetical protein